MKNWLETNNKKDIFAEKFKKGGKPEKKPKIYIKPENRGKFTATKKATGKTTEELTHSKNPVTKKRAIFAQNAKKWKHEDGGKFNPSLKNVEKKQKGDKIEVTNDSTKYYSDKLKTNISDHFKAKTKAEKDLAAQKATQSKNSLNRQANKGKVGFDKNGFPLVKKQNGGEMPKGGDQAAVYKKGTKIDASKWKKSK